MAALAWALANWKLVAAGAAFVAVIGALAAAGITINNRAYERGYATHQAEQAVISQEKTNAANRADDAAARCALDPDCRLRDDGYRRE
ncbi:hypothetical protein [Xanthobacter sp. VNH20]|uniref:hypothetical protein n=1 Tax=Xanthobacter sp. VNH20 TaxID=3156616 RepID=UPI0032B4595B